MYNIYQSTVTSKGQATIPAPLRKKLRIKPGGKIIFEDQPNGVMLNRVPDISELKGSLKPKVKVKYSDRKADKTVAKFMVQEYLKHHGKNP